MHVAVTVWFRAKWSDAVFESIQLFLNDQPDLRASSWNEHAAC
jgi:hypothetical protein